MYFGDLVPLRISGPLLRGTVLVLPHKFVWLLCW